MELKQKTYLKARFTKKMFEGKIYKKKCLKEDKKYKFNQKYFTYKFGTRNSTAVGVQTPLHSLSATLMNPAPLPLIAPIAIMMM